MELTLPAGDDDLQREWNRALDPVATVEPGAVVQFDTPDARDGQFSLRTTVADVGDELVGELLDARAAEPVGVSVLRVVCRPVDGRDAGLAGDTADPP